MANELVRVQDVNMDDLTRVAKMLALSGYFEGKGNNAEAIAKMGTAVLAGREMGYGPFASVTGIHIIKGKPSIGANLMAAAVKAHPKYDYRVRKMSNDEVSIEFFEGGESIGVSTFTLEDAKRAESGSLVAPGAKANMLARFSRNILFARAMSNGVKWFCPDVFNGNTVYVPEELGAEVDEDGNAIEGTWQISEPEPQPQQPKRPQTPQDAPHGDVAENPATDTAEPAQPSVEAPDNPFDGPTKLTDGQLKALHAAGRDLYGDDWDKERPRLVEFITAGAQQSATELTPKEAKALISGMQKRIDERNEQNAIQLPA